MEKFSNIKISTRSSVGDFKVGNVIIANNVPEKEKVVDFGNIFQNKNEKLSRILPALKNSKNTSKKNIAENNITLS